MVWRALANTESVLQKCLKLGTRAKTTSLMVLNVIVLSPLPTPLKRILQMIECFILRYLGYYKLQKFHFHYQSFLCVVMIASWIKQLSVTKFRLGHQAFCCKTCQFVQGTLIPFKLIDFQEIWQSQTRYYKNHNFLCWYTEITFQTAKARQPSVWMCGTAHTPKLM